VNRFAFAVVAAGAVVGCSSSPDQPPSPVTNITVSTGDLVPAFSPDVFQYEVTSLTTLVPVDITVTGQDVTIGDAAVKDGVPYEMTVPSLDDQTSIVIHATSASGIPATYTISTAPANRPRYDVTTLSSPEPGLILLTPFQIVGQIGGPTYLYILDETGRLVFYRQTLLPAADFERRTLSGGAVRYTYVVQDQPVNLATWPVVPSTAYVLDDHFRQMQTIKLAAAGSHPASDVDIHEFQLLADDHWIVQSYLDETVTNVPRHGPANVVSGVVQEVQGGNVVFDWETTSDPALYTESSDGNDYFKTTTYADYNHLNAIDIDPSTGNLVVSVRHDDEIVELDRATGQRVWTLGGVGDDFGLAAADKPSHQHCVRFVGPGDITLFDNGNASQETKVREYAIDPANHTAQVLAAIAVDGHFSAAMGSVQKINGHYFVGWGYRRDGESDVTEIDATTHQKSFELSFQNGYVSYRAMKFAP
jgi:arylsulfate sulfotransferase